MENTKLNIISALERVFLQAKDSKLERNIFKSVEKELSVLNEYFHTNDMESILITLVMNVENFENARVKKMASYVGLNHLNFLPFATNLMALHQRNIITPSYGENYELSEDYALEPKLITYLSKNERIPSEILQVSETENNFHEFINEIDGLNEKKAKKKLNEFYFRNELNEITNKYTQFKLVSFAKKNLNMVEQFIFFVTIVDAISYCNNDYNTNLQNIVEESTFKKRDAFEYVQNFLQNKTRLNKLKLVEKDSAAFSNRHYIRLTQNALKMLSEWEGINIEFKEDEKNKKLLYPEQIKKNKLIYNPSELEAIVRIDGVLAEKSFQKLKSNLTSNNLPEGITCLLYGEPGTGKTATVYELARKHKRAVFKVEISETKSMWYGESQKLVKKIFTDYYDAKEKEKRCPILLFNEADAIIGKRKVGGNSSVSETENAIQNILLEELENFKGILFATSNLVMNLDEAFERRFLFKVKYAKPSLQNAAAIWKIKLPNITNKQAMELATHYPFSGGEIDNIVRKYVMESVLQGKQPSFNAILSFCNQEKWQATTMGNKIGY
jgi:ATP-dependent Clp protease ATP-binding subunit ClpA